MLPTLPRISNGPLVMLRFCGHAAWYGVLPEASMRMHGTLPLWCGTWRHSPAAERSSLHPHRSWRALARMSGRVGGVGWRMWAGSRLWGDAQPRRPSATHLRIDVVDVGETHAQERLVKAGNLCRHVHARHALLHDCKLPAAAAISRSGLLLAAAAVNLLLLYTYLP